MKATFSFCSINFIKKNCVVIKNINGNISNKIDGIFKKVKKDETMLLSLKKNKIKSFRSNLDQLENICESI